MNEYNYRQLGLELIKRADATFLTTVDGDGYPQSRAMVNLHNPILFPHADKFLDTQDDFLIYFTTHSQSEKMKQLKANSKVSAYYCDAKIFHGLMLGGIIEEVSDTAMKDILWNDEWTINYPSGKNGPEYAILRLRTAIAKGWYQTGPFEINL